MHLFYVLCAKNIHKYLILESKLLTGYNHKPCTTDVIVCINTTDLYKLQEPQQKHSVCYTPLQK